ncbi:MAG: hypothetical protein CMI78_00490 [Candidatus Pelagibacter sp.]|nr:hypothetical protein [Candidatus Pelagibacter sp.]
MLIFSFYFINFSVLTTFLVLASNLISSITASVFKPSIPEQIGSSFFSITPKKLFNCSFKGLFWDLSNLSS